MCCEVCIKGKVPSPSWYINNIDKKFEKPVHLPSVSTKFFQASKVHKKFKILLITVSFYVTYVE